MENINKLDEFEIWNNIFISDSKEEIEHLIKLCKFYDVSADYILGFTNNRNHLPKI